MRYDMKSYNLEIDDSEVTYPAHMADSVLGFKKQLIDETMNPSLVKKLDQNTAPHRPRISTILVCVWN